MNFITYTMLSFLSDVHLYCKVIPDSEAIMNSIWFLNIDLQNCIVPFSFLTCASCQSVITFLLFTTFMHRKWILQFTSVQPFSGYFLFLHTLVVMRSRCLSCSLFYAQCTWLAMDSLWWKLACSVWGWCRARWQ